MSASTGYEYGSCIGAPFRAKDQVDIRYDAYLQKLSRRVVQGPSAALVNWAILDLAAKVCTIRNPRCGVCPVLPTGKRSGLPGLQPMVRPQ